jgi:hypothetical protein
MNCNNKIISKPYINPIATFLKHRFELEHAARAASSAVP